MKLFHLSDVHVGTYIGKPVPVPNAALSLHQSVFDVFKALDTVIEDAKQEKPDAFLFAGDLFHRVVNSRVVLSALSYRINEMTKIAPVVIIVGNHDIVANTHMMSELGYYTIHNLYIIDEPTVVNIPGKQGNPDISIVGMGWPVNIMREHTQQESESDLNRAKDYGRHNAQKYVNDSASELVKTVPAGNIKIFVGHGMVLDTFSGDELDAIGTAGVSEDIAFFPKNLQEYDYCALGHIHLRKFDEKKKVCYPGSLYPENFGEANTPHGYAVVEIDEKRELSVRFRDIEIRPYSNVTVRTSKFSAENEIIEFVLKYAEPNPERFLRIRVVVDDDSLDISPNTLQEVLEKHYAYMVVDKYYNIEETTSSPEATWQSGDTIVSLVKRFLSSQELGDSLKTNCVIRLRTLMNSSSTD